MLITGGSTHQTSRCVILLWRTRFKRIRHSVALRPSDISQRVMYYDGLINDLAYVYRQLNGGLLNVLWNSDVFVFTRIEETCLWLEQTSNKHRNFWNKGRLDVFQLRKTLKLQTDYVFISLSSIKTNRKINQIRVQWLQHKPTVFSVHIQTGS